MIHRQNKLDNYFRVRVEGASPMGLIYMIYDGAIKDLQDAKKALNGRSRDDYSRAIVHAQDCIRELRNALKFEEGPQGEIAANLYRLYSFCINQLIEANLDRSSPGENLNEVLKILRDLKTAWQQGEKRLQKEKGSNLDRNVSISA